MIRTAKGDVTLRREVFRSQSPKATKPLVTDPEQETDALLATLTDPWHRDPSPASEVRKALEDRGILAAGTPVPLA